MTAFIVRRVAGLLLTALAASVIIFLVVDLLPGDAAQILLGVEARPDTLAALQEKLGTDRPAVERYLDWIVGCLTGDFGTSYIYDEPVGGMIGQRLEVSLPLALGGILLSTVIAIPLGTFAAANHRRVGDYGVMAFTQVGVAVPNFWLGMLLVLIFATWLEILPAIRFPGWGEDFGGSLASLIMPVVALALPQAAILARVVRSSVLEVLGEPYIRTAAAKGLTRWRILVGHALRNALIPIVTLIGLQLSFVVAGAIVIESVFTLPGLGRLITLSISNRDLIVIQSVVLLLAVMVILVNFLVDLAYVWLDPRIRLVHHEH